MSHAMDEPDLHNRAAMTRQSFLVHDSPDEYIVRFDWDGESSIGLELVRLKASQHTRVIHWTNESLGVTFGIEDVSRRVIVTRTQRDDIRPGYLLVKAMGDEITEANFDERMHALKCAHEISRGIPFEFASPPPPTYVRARGHLLKQAGIENTFELRFIGDRPIRYLSMEEIHDLIRRSPKPLGFTFVQRKDSAYLAQLKKESTQDSLAAASLAAAAAVVAFTIT